MSQQIGLLGYPLVHSISPAFQQAALDHYSLPIVYRAWPTPPDRLSDIVEKLRGGAYLGANVTIPHKEAVRGLLDATDPWAEAVGAVNTIVKEDGAFIGHNTDSIGLLRSLRDRAGLGLRGASVLLLGAGGAARAAAFALAGEGIARLTIANRTVERAMSLSNMLRGKVAQVDAVPLVETALSKACERADLIVNATSIGMMHSPAQGLTPLRGDLIPPSALVYDMVYTPAETPLLMEARKAGARTVGGLWMLIYQGAASFELWTGKDAPIDVMYRAGEKALAAMTRRV